MKLTDRIQASGASLTDLIHIVITSDTTQNSAGSSFKIPMSEYAALFGGGTDSYWTSGSTGTNSIKAINSSSIDATGNYAVAEGRNTIASGSTSHAEGNGSIAGGDASHAEGQGSRAFGGVSHAEGFESTAFSDYSHAEGQLTTALGVTSHAEGNSSIAGVYGFYVTGITNGLVVLDGKYGDTSADYSLDDIIFISDRDYVNDFGPITVIVSGATYDVGLSATTIQLTYTGNAYDTLAAVVFNLTNETFGDTPVGGENSHSEGYYTRTLGFGAHAEGGTDAGKGPEAGGKAVGDGSHAEGRLTFALGITSHAEGSYTIASGDRSHAEGYQTTASESESHAEGYGSLASGSYSHAEGSTTTASGGFGSHAEGENTLASGNMSHAQGNYTEAFGQSSHAEGYKTIASGYTSHAEGHTTTAIGQASHAGGTLSVASGDYSFVHGSGSTASGTNTIVLGVGLSGTASDTTYTNKVKSIYGISGGTVDAPSVNTANYTELATSVNNNGYTNIGNINIVRPYGLTADSPAGYIGSYNAAYWDRDTPYNLTGPTYSLCGVDAAVYVVTSASTTLDRIIGFRSSLIVPLSGATITEGHYFRCNAPNETTMYGMQNVYGYYMEPHAGIPGFTAGTTNLWGVYINDLDAKNYFGNTVGIGTNIPYSGSILELESTTKALVITRMTDTQATAITPINGMMLYVTTIGGVFISKGFWGYEEGVWVKL